MKNAFRIILMSMAITMSSLYSNASNLPTDPAKEAVIYSHLVTRVNEIQNMDKSGLTGSEKSSLKKELRQMKKQAAGLDRKVYLSVGAVIIIILLLILIL